MKILLADDNPEVRSALRLLLEQEPLLAVVMEVADSQTLLVHVSETCPMVLLLDWELPGLQTSGFINLLRSHCPRIKVIALSSRFEARQEALAAGMDAFVSKAEPPEKILSTVWSFVPNPTKEGKL
jgi:CheY-like chemotaxis protein